MSMVTRAFLLVLAAVSGAALPVPPAPPMLNDFDVLVIGAGTAGVEAAIAASSYGRQVGLVERHARITGAPTGAHSKEMREAVYEGARTFADVSEVITASADRAQASTEERLRDFGVVTLRGDAVFENASTVRIDTVDGKRIVTAAYVVIATGSHAFRPSSIPFELPGVFDSDTIQAIDYLPHRVVVQGGGPVGLEYALAFAKLGAQVTIVESSQQILPDNDSSLREAVLASLNNAGVQLLVGTSVDSVKEAAGNDGHSIGWQGLVDVQAGSHMLESDCFLYSLNWTCSVEGLGLKALPGLELGDHYHIVTDERQRTGVDGIYAIGDVAGGGLASVAQAQAITAVKDLVSRSGRSWTIAEAPTVIASGLWTIPSVAWAGRAEETQAQDPSVDAVRVQYNTTVRGWISGENGFLKLVYSRTTGEVLGVHLSGENSMELVGFGAEAINTKRTIFDLIHDVLPAVTLGQIYRKAAEKAWLKSFKESSMIV